MSSDIRIHEHGQKYPIMIASDPLAPIKDKVSGKLGKPRFSIEDKYYMIGVGWEDVDRTKFGNVYMIKMLNYIEMKEMLGYEHTGVSSQELQKQLEELWGYPRSEW